MKMFRTLTADEIVCRVQSVKANGLSLLLYKDARCDMNILDETVGAYNWKRSHTRDNANCIVSIYDTDKKEWISKEDTGTESNTEAEKGLASDSFKRACVNWGIGRELYSAPFIWIKAGFANIDNRKCYDKFKVTHIDYGENNEITELEICNTDKEDVLCFKFKDKKTVFLTEPDENSKSEPKSKAENSKSKPQAEQPKTAPQTNARISNNHLMNLGTMIVEMHMAAGYLEECFKVDDLADLSEKQYQHIIEYKDKHKQASDEWKQKQN